MLNIFKVIFFWGLIGFFAIDLLKYMNGNIINFKYGFITPFVDLVKDVLQKGTMWHFWYFGALSIVYIVLPVLVKICQKPHGKIRLWLILVIISVTIQIMSYFMRSSFQLKIIQTFRIWTWLQYFLLGGIFGEYKDKITNRCGMYKQVIALIIFSTAWVAWQITAGKHLLNDLHAEYFYDDAITIAVTSIFSSLILSLKLSEPIKQQIESFVGLSMTVYIIHPLILFILTHFIGNNELILFILLTISSFLLAFIIKEIKLFDFFLKL